MLLPDSLDHIPFIPTLIGLQAFDWWEAATNCQVGQTPVFGLPLQLFGTHFGQHGLFGCCLNTKDFLQPQGPSPQAFNPLWRGWVYCLAPEAPLLRGMPTGPKVFLAMLDACGLRPGNRTHLKNGLVSNSFVQWGVWQIPGLHQSTCASDHFQVNQYSIGSSRSFLKFVLYRNTWNYITVQIICIKNSWSYNC